MNAAPRCFPAGLRKRPELQDAMEVMGLAINR